MKIAGIHQRSIWTEAARGPKVFTLDQRKLPFATDVVELDSSEAVRQAICDMTLRGAPLIGVAAAYGMWLACAEAERQHAGTDYLLQVAERMKSARPTAVNLRWAVERMEMVIHLHREPAERTRQALAEAERIADEDAERCRMIGEHGKEILKKLYAEKKRRLNILTHCNAGWLATVDYGTATAPLYLAHEAGIPIHVWVDETRPRNQGGLTAWELKENGVPHTYITDNAGGLLMMQGKVDLVITGADRVTVNGDVANKIGTYLKALAAHDNGVPFMVAFPSSTIDWNIFDGLTQIHIEERDAEEVTHVRGDHPVPVRVTPEGTAVHNPGFDITPARLITGLITERGTCEADARGLYRLFPEYAPIA